MDVKVLSKIIKGTVVLAGLLVAITIKAEDRVYNLNSSQTKQVKETKTPKKALLKITGDIGDVSFANEQGERSQSAAFVLGEEFKYRLTDEVHLNVDSKLYTFAGQSLSRFGDGIPTNGIYLKEALVEWQPFQFVSVAGGAINQRYLNSGLLIYEKAFPGAREKLAYNTGNFTASLTAEQTVPTSASLSTKTADREDQPSFFAETLSGKFDVIRSFAFEFFGTFFDFRNLPSQVAFDSSLYGNTATQMSSPNSAKFIYEYAGWLLGAKGDIELSRQAKLLVAGSLLSNELAPTAFNHGQIVSAGAEFSVTDNLSINPTMETFFNESDSAPAYYNDFVYGHNNRQGYGAYLTLDFKKSNFKLIGFYVDADVINFNVNQSRQQVYLIKLETSYDVL